MAGSRRIALLIAAATLLAYLPALGAGFVWDDDGHVTRPELRSVAGLARIWTAPSSTEQYYPLTHTAYWILHQLWGEAPFPYHLANVLLHAAAAWLAWRVLVRLAVPGALLAAFLFALHPVHVESVAWVSELKNTLSGVFALASLHAWLAFDPPEGVGDAEGAGRARDGRKWALALAFFVCAVLAKIVAVTLPAAILLIAWWKAGRIDVRRTLLPLAPFVIVGVGLGLLTAWLERHVGGAEVALTAGQRVLLAGTAPLFYLGKLLWPVGLCFVYPRFELDVGDVRAWLLPAATILVLTSLWLARRRIGRGPMAAALIFVATLAPVLGPLDVFYFQYSFVADHFQYHASLAPLALMAAAIARRHLVPAGAVACAVLGGLAFAHARDFRDAETLWRATLARNPDAFMASNNLAHLLIGQGRFAEARDAAERSIRARPDDARAHVNLGVALHELARNEEAIEPLRRATELDPRHASARVNLGNVLLALKRSDEAVAEYELAVELDPRLTDAWFNLGVARHRRSELQAAEAAYQRALEIDAGRLDARFNLAVVRLQAGRRAEARADLEEILRRDPVGAAGARARELLETYR